MKSRRSRAVHATVCALCCGAFVLLSVPRFWNPLTLGRFGPVEPFFSTDRDIEGLTGVSQGSERIRQTIAALPGSKRLVVILPEYDAPSIYFGLMVAYLAWPRPVEPIHVYPPDVPEHVRRLNPTTFAAILFCRVPPPAFVPPGVTWAPGMILVPSPAASAEEVR